MAIDIVDYVEGWMETNVTATSYPEEENDPEVAAYAKSLEADALVQGFTLDQVEEELGCSLEEAIFDFMVDQVEDEDERQVANDK